MTIISNYVGSLNPSGAILSHVDIRGCNEKKYKEKPNECKPYSEKTGVTVTCLCETDLCNGAKLAKWLQPPQQPLFTLVMTLQFCKAMQMRFM